MIKFIKEVPLYPSKFGICITNDPAKDGKYFGLHFSEDEKGFEGCCCRGNLKGKKIIVIVIYPKYTNSWGLWAHESLHCVNEIFDYVGIKADNNNDEAHAYLLSWFMEEIQNFVEKNKEEIAKLIV